MNDRRMADEIAVFYLARGADQDAADRAAAFATSYRRWNAGTAHRLYVLYKGYEGTAALQAARAQFDGLDTGEIYLRDDGFDLGAYRAAAYQTPARLICCLNSASIILCDSWLLKLKKNLGMTGVGVVGGTGSYEAPPHPEADNIRFPNPHLRSNAFLIDRLRFLAIVGRCSFESKNDAYAFEHGPRSLTRRIHEEGLEVLVVGRDGLGYTQERWVHSGTFRQGAQDNLIVGDNQTRGYHAAPMLEKRMLFRLAWGNGERGQVRAQPRTLVGTANL